MTMQTFTPAEYLQIDIASSFGLEKKLWDERLAWFADNKTQIEALAALTTGIAKHPLMAQAKEPAQFFAGVKAWAQTQRGEPTGHLIHLDGTASGAQCLAALVDCSQSGSNCNLVDTGERENLYANIFSACQTIAEHGLDALPEDVKKAVMTSLYGSKRQPRRVFGEDIEVFYKTMEEQLPGAWALNEALIGLWQPYALSHDWILPDNFHAHIKVMSPFTREFTVFGQLLTTTSYANIGTERGLSLAANVTHSVDGMVVREVGRRCNYDPIKIEALKDLLDEIDVTGTYSTTGRMSPHHKLVETLWSHYLESGFLSARILEALDTENIHLVDYVRIRKLVDTLPRKPFAVLMIHDAFAVHPNYGNDVRRTYNRILSEIADSEMLSFIISRIAGEKLNVAKFGGGLAEKILEANYALS